MTAWLQQLSPLPLAIVCSGAFVLLTWFGIIFVRPFLRLLLRRQPGANDLVSYTSSWFSLLYGRPDPDLRSARGSDARAALPGQRGLPRAAALRTPVSAPGLHALRRAQGLASAPPGADLAGRCGAHGRARAHAGDLRADHEGTGDHTRAGEGLIDFQDLTRPLVTGGTMYPPIPEPTQKRAGPAKREGRPARRRPPCACVAW